MGDGRTDLQARWLIRGGSFRTVYAGLRVAYALSSSPTGLGAGEWGGVRNAIAYDDQDDGDFLQVLPFSLLFFFSQPLRRDAGPAGTRRDQDAYISFGSAIGPVLRFSSSRHSFICFLHGARVLEAPFGRDFLFWFRIFGRPCFLWLFHNGLGMISIILIGGFHV